MNGLTLDTTTRTLFRDGHSVRLTPIEWRIFGVLDCGGMAIETTAIVERVWGHDPNGGPKTVTNCVHVHCGNLRRRLRLVDIGLESKKGVGSCIA
jgi:DNA-binding response OmpR family regulator